MGKRGGRWRGRSTVAVALLLIVGCAYLGVGISDVYHAGQISRHGITVTATVAQDQGWGRYAVRVRYLTAAGQQEQGTLGTPRQSASYPVGSPVRVVYDPASPSIVTMPGSGGSGGWPEVVIGVLILLLLAVLGSRAWLRPRRRSARPGTAG